MEKEQKNIQSQEFFKQRNTYLHEEIFKERIKIIHLEKEISELKTRNKLMRKRLKSTEKALQTAVDTIDFLREELNYK